MEVQSVEKPASSQKIAPGAENSGDWGSEEGSVMLSPSTAAAARALEKMLVRRGEAFILHPPKPQPAPPTGLGLARCGNPLDGASFRDVLLELSDIAMMPWPRGRRWPVKMQALGILAKYHAIDREYSITAHIDRRSDADGRKALEVELRRVGLLKAGDELRDDPPATVEATAAV